MNHLRNRLYADIREAEAASLKMRGLSNDEKAFWRSQIQYAQNKLKLYGS
ncbi:MAG: hypothetical protein RIA63_13865 [Cyclobacteriaceae bacterium]